MKLLFDQNLSARLPLLLFDLFPMSQHVRHCGLLSVPDLEVWKYAKDKDYVIVSKDRDFHRLSLRLGAPPKVIWLRTGNCTTHLIEDLIRRSSVTISTFGLDSATSHLILP